jgi:hypothetical protein
MTLAAASSKRAREPAAEAKSQARALLLSRHEHDVVRVPAPPGTGV